MTDWPERARAERYNVQMLARQSGVPVRTFQRRARKEFNLSPKDWLLKLKMQRACELLLKGLDLKQVSIEMQYRHYQHFSRDFKRRQGCSPTQYMVLHKDAIRAARRRAGGG
jgi:AraC-like DNA-binding protein